MAQNLTEVRLLSVPLENDYLHTIYFETIGEQESYFKSKTKHIFTDCSYQRKDSMIRASKHIDDIVNCNYVMYRNRPYTDKWCYAFITKMEYKDDGRTDVYIETDVMQTWLQDYVVKASFVEREHCRDDTPGLHTVPEQLETGDYICNEIVWNDELISSGIVIGSTADITQLETLGKDIPNSKGSVYNGVFSGVSYFYFDRNVNSSVGTGGVEDLRALLYYLGQNGISDCITCMFIVPSSLIYKGTACTLNMASGQNSIKFWRIQQGTNSFETIWSGTGSGVGDGDDTPIRKPTTVNGHTPKNKKLLTDPYCYLLVDNNAGGCAKYKYERFDTDQCTFDIRYCLTPGGSTRLIPLFYEGLLKNNKEGLNGGKYPICSWNTDVYINWLTQNSVNIANSLFSNIATGITGLAGMSTGIGMLVGGSMALSGVVGVGNTVGEIVKHSFQPPQLEGNLNSGDVTFGTDMLTFTAYQMSIKKEFAEIIDNYFSMFGYKTNRVKVPYYNHRKHWWYTKTIDVNIDLSSNSKGIPQADLLKIKECYNKGITFWKPSSIGDYSLDNPITWEPTTVNEE